jgi:hypothetical protein
MDQLARRIGQIAAWVAENTEAKPNASTPMA